METQSCVENKRNESSTDRSECSDANASQTLFTRANVVAQESKIRLVDSDEETGLDLFCYNRCSNEEDDFVKQCRGLVFHGDTLVMKAFSYTTEYSHDDPTLPEVFSDLPNWSFFTAYEGALLRLFYFSGRWFLSTHRKLNAFRSKWASRESFGTLFKRALENEMVRSPDFASRLGEGENVLDRFQSSLDKSKQYMFLLRNCSDNRIVCSPPAEGEPLIFHVGTFLGNDHRILSMAENIGLSYPERHEFFSLDDLVNFVQTEVDPKRVQGVVCFGTQNRQVKVLHPSYMEMFRARGNEPSVKFRYLQVRMNRKMVDMLYQLYPDLAPTFDDYENTIYDIARSIYRSYVQRFIKRNYVTVPKEEYLVINECHSWHLSDRENNRVNLDRVIQMLNKQPPTNLNHMIRRFKIEQAKKQATLPRTVRGSRNNSPAITGMAGPEPLVLKRLLPPKLQ
jgi:hypothetical protein